MRKTAATSDRQRTRKALFYRPLVPCRHHPPSPRPPLQTGGRRSRCLHCAGPTSAVLPRRGGVLDNDPYPLSKTRRNPQETNGISRRTADSKTFFSRVLYQLSYLAAGARWYRVPRASEPYSARRASARRTFLDDDRARYARPRTFR